MSLRITKGPENAPLSPLLNQQVAVIGYGNQGHAHALNLRESGIRVVVANRPDTANGRAAQADGFDPWPIADAVALSKLVVMALPDEVQPEVFQSQVLPSLAPSAVIGFLHGFNIRFGLIQPPPGVGVIMVAPKGPGATLRDRFMRGQGIPCLLAVHQDSPNHDAEGIALAWANGIGCARAGIIHTTFKNETDTDLFGEQAVLCGGMTQLILAAFETLVTAGYPPELAYLECCHEVKQIADLVYERGLAGMMKAISNTAEFGAYQAGPVVIDDAVREKMKSLLKRIENGQFAADLAADYRAGFAWFSRQREALRQHPIEAAGDSVRSLMPWLNTTTSASKDIQL